jgi:hypothetical protein
MGLTSGLGSLMTSSFVLMNTDTFSFLEITFSSLCVILPSTTAVYVSRPKIVLLDLDVSPIFRSIYDQKGDVLVLCRQK